MIESAIEEMFFHEMERIYIQRIAADSFFVDSSCFMNLFDDFVLVCSYVLKIFFFDTFQNVSKEYRKKKMFVDKKKHFED